ncbi:hypothetical protein EST38_g10850 [Candolleomyces aberdarensis]|uniref:Uncharacterized protein n=1 Tax=Candolleomyces aberdarensis TaxID=2316362 RepID=A0A4Q2D6C1_9AGAR|nr:hypothetical protein EST38_g10850 [Candolleomyces aberdarensis]
MPTDHTVVAKEAGNGYPCSRTPEESDAEYRGAPFPNALVQVGSEGAVLQPITRRELTMMRFMNQVTDKPGWATKVFDETIIAKWKEESVGLADSSIETEISEKMFTYCISELQHLAKEHPTSPNGAIRVFNGDVYKSDTAVFKEAKLALQKAVRILEDVPESQKDLDWHPGSDGKVLDLVHPSLFPMIYGKSRALPVGSRVTTLEDCIKRCGEGDVLNVKTSNRLTDEDPWSDNSGGSHAKSTFQDTSQEFLPTSTICILNTIAGCIFSSKISFMRLFRSGKEPSFPKTTCAPFPRRIEYTFCNYNPDPEAWPEEEQIQQEEGEDEGDFWERRQEWIKQTRVVEQPEPEQQFKPTVFEREPLNFKEEFGILPLQVIVKLANIELTPEKPEYGGGGWHVEGKRNKSICATAIYYYSSENITPSSLAFRQQSDGDCFTDFPYQQGQHDFLDAVFGLSNWSDSVQDMGSVDTREGRIITFPNILQHQVQPFKLADPTKPGHRKILALFLVDPNPRVISTAEVPCQRQDWWWNEILKATSASSASFKTPSFADAKAAAGVHKLPAELQKIVFDDVDDFPISMDEAKEYREQLMDERKKFVLEHQREFAAHSISLCEH